MSRELVHSIDWSDGVGGWSTEASKLEEAKHPERIEVNHPLIDYIIWFTGNCGWAIKAKKPFKEGLLEIRTMAYIVKSSRNSLSFNVRDSKGDMIFKYSFAEKCKISANCQPVSGSSEDQPTLTELAYRTKHPFELISYHNIGTNVYTLALQDTDLTAELRSSFNWKTKNNNSPAMLDIDQEGSGACAGLGKIEIYLTV